MRILIVDDNLPSLQSLSLVLHDLGHEPTPFEDPLAALAEARTTWFPLIITDIRMPGMDGLTLLSHLKEDSSTAEADVVLITGHGDMETAVEALRRGAYDYLNKPINARELAAVVERCAEHQALLMENRELREHLDEAVEQRADALRRELESARTRLRQVTGIGEVVAASSVMSTLLDETRVFHAEPSVPVLIEGETGTGKEVVARLIHYGESGNDAPFIALNCAAIPHELFEAELFGHEPGAYTGSRAGGSPGKLELAGSGTLFLDEVAEMPLTLQPKLLRVLEERCFYRLGGVKRREFRARVICAGNRDLAAMVEAGQFRRDLYHRLRVGHLRIPPLRERPEDIPVLAGLFLQREAVRKKKRFTALSPDALRLLGRHPWTGNVRELENAVERAVLLHDGPALTARHLGFLDEDGAGESPLAVRRDGDRPGAWRLDPDNLTLPDAPFDVEALVDALVRKAVERFGGNKSRAAAHLGISRFALHRRLAK